MSYSARIKVHRYCAFFDVPVFSGKHCDLRSTHSGEIDSGDELRLWPSCSCSSFSGGSNPLNAGIAPGATTTPPAAALWPSPEPDENHGSIHSPASHSHNSPFPFSSHQSAKICLKSALSIAAAFEALPYPNTTGQFGQSTSYLSPTSAIIAPRTMPSFACCAMQCAYSLLMVQNKTKSIYPESSGSGLLVDSLLLRLQGGLTSILATLENYSLAFEALGGMRGTFNLA